MQGLLHYDVLQFVLETLNMLIFHQHIKMSLGASVFTRRQPSVHCAGSINFFCLFHYLSLKVFFFLFWGGGGCCLLAPAFIFVTVLIMIITTAIHPILGQFHDIASIIDFVWRGACFCLCLASYCTQFSDLWFISAFFTPSALVCDI